MRLLESAQSDRKHRATNTLATYQTETMGKIFKLPHKNTKTKYFGIDVNVVAQST